MAAPVRVSERDLHTLLGIVSDNRGDLSAQGLPPSLLTDLWGLIPSDFVSFFGLDGDRREQWFGQDIPAGDGDAAGEAGPEVFWSDYYWASEPCSYPDRTGDLRSVTKISDFYSARQWHSTGMYHEVVHPGGIEHQLTLCLPAGPGRIAGPGQTVRLIFSRGPGRDFSGRDRALLTLLRPHLHQAYLDAEHRRRGTPQLTPRQSELLRLVAAGHTNAQIARQLGVVGGNCTHPPTEHLCQAAGIQPHCRSHPRVHRPRRHVMARRAPQSQPAPGAISQLSHRLPGRHRTRADGLDIERILMP